MKTSHMWELLNDVINDKFPNFQQNMGIHFNNFHEDVSKVATYAAGGIEEGVSE